MIEPQTVRSEAGRVNGSARFVMVGKMDMTDYLAQIVICTSERDVDLELQMTEKGILNGFLHTLRKATTQHRGNKTRTQERRETLMEVPNLALRSLLRVEELVVDVNGGDLSATKPASVQSSNRTDRRLNRLEPDVDLSLQPQSRKRVSVLKPSVVAIGQVCAPLTP